MCLSRKSKRLQVVLKMSDIEVNKSFKILGTQYDRRRRFKDKDRLKMLKLLKKGKTYEEVAGMYNTSVGVIRYNTDPEYRLKYNNDRRGKYKKHAQLRNIDAAHRADYKRWLVTEGYIEVK